jgi:hypothetical protein
MASTATQQRRPVEVARRVPIPLDAAVAVLSEDLPEVIGRRLPLPGARQLGRDVRVGFGPVLEDEGVTAIPVWWEDAEHQELFPTFDGGLELRAAPDGTELRLVGSYRPPFGALGRFADGLLGHRIVTASLDAFITAAAERLAEAAGAP